MCPEIQILQEYKTLMQTNHIYTLPDQQYKPPIESKLTELPLKEMSWENFERLCLRMVQEVDSFSIGQCDTYGRKGQKQEGIDIYAKNSNGLYQTYQCKRYQSLSVKKLEQFFEEFKSGDWFSKTVKFNLCTSAEFADVNLQKKFEEIKEEFKDRIDIEKWDNSFINRELKKHPLVVYDFFGEEWCKCFCGKDVFDGLLKSFENRLDANKVGEYKDKIGKFYSDVFNIFDKGLPSLEDFSLKIEDRFVMPDVIKESQKDILPFEEKNEVFNEDISFDSDYLELPFEIRQNDYSHRILRKQNKKIENKSSKQNLRKRIDEEVDEDSLIIGDAGYGKSTFLRFLVLNILNDITDTSTILSKRFGNYLPIYVPFAYLTSKLSENRNSGLLEILKVWFSSFDKLELFDLIELAYVDERLLLIVDGIDEYTSLELAEAALNKLSVYRENSKVRIIFSSRPYGYRILKDYIPKSRILNIAPLSIAQQKNIVTKWMNIKYESDSKIAKRSVDNFFLELSKTSDLKSLSETPLLLNILLVQKLKDLALPCSLTCFRTLLNS